MVAPIPPARTLGDSNHTSDHNAITENLRTPSVAIDVERHFANNLPAAFAEAATSGGPTPLVQLGRGEYALTSGPLVMPRGMTLRGAGKATRIKHGGSYTGYLIKVDDGTRNGEWQEGDTTYSYTNDKGGSEISHLSVIDDDRNSVRHGIYVQRADDLLMNDVRIGFMGGTGLALGSLESESVVGSVRESDFFNVRVYKSGSPGYPAWRIGHSASGSSDGSNQLYFKNFRSVYNHSGGLIINPHASETCRRILFTDTQLHGLTGATLDHDLLTIEGGVSTVQMDGLIANSGPATATGFACIRVKTHATVGGTPGRLVFSRVDLSNNDGDFMILEKCSSFRLEGMFHVSSVLGRFVSVAADAGLGGFEVNVVTSVAPTGKLDIPSTLANKGVANVNGAAVTLPY